MALAEPEVSKHTAKSAADHRYVESGAIVPTSALPDHLPDPSRSAGPLTPAGEGEIIAMIGEGDLPIIMVNALCDAFGHVTVIREQKQPTADMVRRRVRLLGPISTFGQIAFGVALKRLHRRAAPRKAELLARHALETTLPAADRVSLHDVETINDPACAELITALAPKAIAVIGTRMIRHATLDAAAAVGAPIINYHAGLNPTYRGMNGGYWAIASGDPAGAGVTVHLVDRGVDTGAALYWQRFPVEPGDTFVTYPLQQAAVGRDLLVAAIDDARSGTLAPRDVPLASHQWFHPTLWGYLWTGVRKGVW
ncbi:MAG: formyl transferase [Pseudomonadota bacterium]